MKLYIIDEQTLKSLLASQIELDFLYAMGVDNWSGYDGIYKQEYLSERADGALDDEELEDDYIQFEDIADLEIRDYKVYEE